MRKALKKVLSMVLVIGMAFCAIPAQAQTLSDLPDKVINRLGIFSSVTLSAEVTRGQFAQVLLNASEYKGETGSSIIYNVFEDVPANYTYGPAIYVAAQKGWITGYLNGQFKPDQTITLREAMYGVVALLGYTNSDFTGNQLQGRIALYYARDLDDNIALSMDSALTASACTNLIYNLMKATAKTGSLYGKLFDCELDSDGEIDYLSLLSSSSNRVTGPILVEKDIDKILPFSTSKASFIVDGESGTEDDVSDGDVLYYSSQTKTVWVYQENVSSGELDSISYDVSGALTPTAVYVGGIKFLLETNDMKLAFSTAGSVKVGDDITVVYDESVGSDGETTYTLKGYLLND